jgi:hypothetical protein
MGNIPITTPQVGPGLGVSSLPQQRTGGMAGRTLEAVATDAEAYLTKIAEQDAAVEGLNRMADFKAVQSQRLAELQTTVKTPDGFTPVALQDFDKASDEFLKGIENPRAAEFVRSRLPEVRASVAGSAVQWETTARQALRAQNFGESINKLSTIVQMDLGAYEGARTDVQASLDAGGFDPVEAGKLRTTALGALARSAVFGELERNPQAMLDRLNKGEFGDLDANVRLQAVNAAQTEIKRREAQAKADAQLLRQEAMVSVSEWVQDDLRSRSETGRGVEPPPGVDLAAVLKPDEAARHQRKQAQADEFYKATADLPTLPPQDMLARIEAAKPQPGQANYAEQADLYNAMRKKGDDVLAARASDPGAYARQTFPAVQQAWQKFESTQAPADLQAAVRANFSAQASAGIPAAARKPLPVSLAKSYAQTITGAAPEQAYKTMKGLASDFGPLWPSVLSQMSRDLPAAYKIAATIDDPINASIMIQSSRQSIDSLKRAAGDSAKTIRTDVEANSDIKALGQSFGLGGARLTAEIINAAEVLALGRAVTLGDGDPVGSAVKAIVNDRYEFGYTNSRPFAVPGQKYRGRVGDIESGASIAIANIDPSRLTLPAIDRTVDPKVQANSYHSAIKRNGYWTNYEGGGGIQLMNERNVPVMVDGKPVRFTWDDLLKINRESPRPISNSYVSGKVGVPMNAVPRKTTPPADAPRPATPPAQPPRRPTVTQPAPIATGPDGQMEPVREADLIAAAERAAAEQTAPQPVTEAQRQRISDELVRLGRERRPQPGRKPDGK